MQDALQQPVGEIAYSAELDWSDHDGECGALVVVCNNRNDEDAIWLQGEEAALKPPRATTWLD